MAFSPIDIPIQEILETDFIVDIRTINNSNFLLLKDELEDLINNLEIDTNTLAIGTDSPISSIKTDVVIMEDTGYVYQTGTPTTIISSLTKNSSDESVLNVDILEVDVSLQADSLSINSALVVDSLTVDGATTFNAAVVHEASVIESKESIAATLTNNANIAEANITLTSATRQNIFLTLDADPTVYIGGGLVGGLLSISVIIDFDASNPPDPNTEFTIYIENIKDLAGTALTIVPAINIYGGGLQLNILAGTNLSTASPITLHSGSTTLDIAPMDLQQMNSLASMIYIVDASGDDRLMIKSTVEMNVS